MTIFHQLLHLDEQTTELINTASVAVSDATGDAALAGTLVEQVKSQVCDNITLYATKYASDFTNYLAEFVKDIWEMLTGMKNTQDPKYDTVSYFCVCCRHDDLGLLQNITGFRRPY